MSEINNQNGESKEVQPNENNEQQNPEGSSEYSPEQIAELERKAEERDKYYEENGSLRRDLKKYQSKKGETENSNKSGEGKSSEFDYGQLGFLAANGIKEQSEIDLAQQIVEDSGKELRDVVNSGYFQAELNNLREQKKAQDAIPQNNSRKGENTSDSVEYWVAKNAGNKDGKWELPDKSTHPELRRKVVKARREMSEKRNKFTSRPLG